MASPLVLQILEMMGQRRLIERDEQQLVRQYEQDRWQREEDVRRRRREELAAEAAAAAAARLAKGDALAELAAERAADVASVGALESESMVPYLAAGQEPIEAPGGGPPSFQDLEARLTGMLGPSIGPGLAKTIAARHPAAMGTQDPPPSVPERLRTSIGALVSQEPGEFPLLSALTLPEQIDPATGARVPSRRVPLRFAENVRAEEARLAQAKLAAVGAETGARLTAEEPFEAKKFERDQRAARAAEAARERREYARQAAMLDKEERTRTDRLRNDYLRETKKLRDGLGDLARFVSPVRSRIAAGETPTPTDQFALIYAFNKALDPDSVVRESEFANTKTVGAGVHEQALLALQKWQKGEQLTAAQIQGMLDTIGRAEASAKTSLSERNDFFRSVAYSNNLDPLLIFGGAEPEAEEDDWQVIDGVKVRKKR